MKQTIDTRLGPGVVRWQTAHERMVDLVTPVRWDDRNQTVALLQWGEYEEAESEQVQRPPRKP